METIPTPYEALIACRDAAGSTAQLARDLGVTQPRAWRWVNESRELPAEYVLTAERLYGVSRHWLRPDIYPVDLPPASARFHGTDLHAGARPTGLDGRANRVSFQRRAGMKGAAL